MKKNLIAIACMAGIASFVSCQKEMLQSDPDVRSGQVITLNVNDNAAVRSAFDGNTTVALTGSEHFNVVYVSNETGKAVGNVEATPSGAGSYTFTVPDDITVSDYSWYAISPYSPAVQTIATTSADLHAKVIISPVQLPGANTFDENYDILLSDKFEVSGGSATINEFKRLSAPLCLAISGLEASDKIFAVTFTLDATPAENTGLVGQLNVKFSETYSEAGTQSISYRGNGVSAIYANGLAAVDNVWPVWFMVNPSAMEQDQTVTVSVTTATKTYKRTVALPSTKSLSNASISKIKFNIKGSGYSETNTIFQAFTEQSVAEAILDSKTPSLTASNSNAYTWQFPRSGCAMKASEVNVGMPYGMQLSAQSGTNKFLYLPSFNKTVTAAHFYMHPANYTSNTASFYTTDSTSVAYASDLAFSNRTLSNKGGVCSVALPDTLTTLGETVLRVSGTTNVAAALFEVVDQAYDSNDYYDMYDKGIDFTIGDKVINKSNYPNSKIIKVENITSTSFASNSGNVIFVDNANQNEIEIASQIRLSGIIVGRYKNSQPSVKSTATGYDYFSTTDGLVVKNLRLEIGSTGMFTPGTEGTGRTTSVTFEDCTLVNTGSGQVFKENNTAYCFNDITVRNSIIQTNNSLLGNNGSARTAELYGAGLEGTITLENNVIMPVPGESSVTSVSVSLIDTKTKAAAGTFQPFILKMNNNTVYYFRMPSAGGVVVAYSIGGISVDSNLFYTDVFAVSTSNTRIIKCSENQSTKPSPLSFTNNWGCKVTYGTTSTLSYLAITNSNTKKYWGNGTSTSPTDKDNSFENTDNPFLSSANPLIGYLPVDTSVVTNGAGATYTTKLWKNWTGSLSMATSEGFHSAD